jgi:hypothetical protein
MIYDYPGLYRFLIIQDYKIYTEMQKLCGMFCSDVAGGVKGGVFVSVGL